MKIDICGYTDVGTRDENQDTSGGAKLAEDRFYAIVADGLGGHLGGKQASGIAVKYLTPAKDGLTGLPSPEALEERLAKANSEILKRRGNADEMKSTVVALYVSGPRAVWVHIGDSRLYHFCNGELAHFTNDHSVPQVAVKLGEITRDQIPQHPDRSRLIRVLGSEELRPEVSEAVELEAGEHAFLLCSDGFWEYLHEDEIMLDLNKSTSAEAWLNSLLWRRKKRLGSEIDNSTAIAAFIEV